MQQNAEQRNPAETDPIGARREENALQHFKNVLKDLLVMIRFGCKADTAYMYWVNRKREQFVLETSNTLLNDVVFQDRVRFSEFPLERWKDIQEPVLLKAGADLDYSELTHHMNGFPAEGLLLLPFINNDETVSLTVVELNSLSDYNTQAEVAVQSYLNAVGNILRTYLELSDMFQDEKRWESYDSALDTFGRQKNVISVFEKMLEEACKMVTSGGASILARSKTGWHVVLSASTGNRIMPVGLKMSDASQSGLCLKSGEPEFTLHYNGNPKRISPKEPPADGASIAVPLMVNYRRHGVLVVWDDNPLLFRESLKHMISNMCRTVGLMLRTDKAIMTEEDDLLASESGAYRMEVIERILEMELKRCASGFRPTDTWLIFITPFDYAHMRSKLGSERVKDLHTALARDLNPNHSGVAGLVGSYTESIFSVLIQTKDPSGVDNWIETFKSYVAERARTQSDYIADTKFHFGITKITETHKDAYTVVQDAKRAMNYAVTRNVEIVQ